MHKNEAAEKKANFFKGHGLSITTSINVTVINFLGITLDVSNGIYKPYTSDLCNHRYISKQSNHLPRILNTLYESVHFRLATNSSSKNIFENDKCKYVESIEKSNHNINIKILNNNNNDVKSLNSANAISYGLTHPSATMSN